MNRSRSIGDTHVAFVYSAIAAILAGQREGSPAVHTSSAAETTGCAAEPATCATDSTDGTADLADCAEEQADNPAEQTAGFLLRLFPRATGVRHKFDFPHPDQQPDLVIQQDGQEHPVNLFVLRGSAPIQPKNPGARSFLAKYFLAEPMQEQFNAYLSHSYRRYLLELLQGQAADEEQETEEYPDDGEQAANEHSADEQRAAGGDLADAAIGEQAAEDAEQASDGLSQPPAQKQGHPAFDAYSDRALRAEAARRVPEFAEPSNRARERFLLAIRDYCFTLLQQTYNANRDGFIHAFRKLLLTDSVTIITRIRRGNQVEVEQFQPQLQVEQPIVPYKKGRHTIGIQYGAFALTLRFKFENKPTSSIKLASSFENHGEAARFASQVEQTNAGTLNRIEAVLGQVIYAPAQNMSNAIGKCHEALVYYRLLQRYPLAIQADADEAPACLAQYLRSIDEHTATMLVGSSVQTAEAISNYLHIHKQAATVQGIQLAADIYTQDRLNTGDIKLAIRRSDGRIEEIFISLKAIRRAGQKITTKNPGIGTILGDTYFGLEADLNGMVTGIKHAFLAGELNHQQCLELLAGQLGQLLSTAPQPNLQRGIAHLLGDALTAITAYEQGIAFCAEHQHIDSEARVIPQHPSPIQTTLCWNDGVEQLTLRVKFSGGQSRGWTSIKLACEYQFHPPQQ